MHENCVLTIACSSLGFWCGLTIAAMAAKMLSPCKAEKIGIAHLLALEKEQFIKRFTNCSVHSRNVSQ